MENYRCVKEYITITKYERINENITIIPYNSIQTELSPHQNIIQ